MNDDELIDIIIDAVCVDSEYQHYIHCYMGGLQEVERGIELIKLGLLEFKKKRRNHE